MALSVELNGRARVVEGLSAGAPLEALIAALDLREDRIAVEVNGEIVPRNRRAEVVVNDGDRLEVVHFVGGGSAHACCCQVDLSWILPSRTVSLEQPPSSSCGGDVRNRRSMSISTSPPRRARDFTAACSVVLSA